MSFRTLRRQRQGNTCKNNLSPSRSSFSKWVLRMERVPPLSTTASSSFLCKQKKGQVSCFLLGINYQDWRVLWNKDMFTIYLFTLPTQESKVFQKFIFIIKVYSFCIRFYWGITANFNIKYFCWNLQDDEKTAVTVNYRKYESVWQWKKWV